jgi:hypothetical protein
MIGGRAGHGPSGRPGRRRATAALPVRAIPSRSRRHAVYRVAPGLLLVFKPRGHSEAEHEHPHRQRLVVVRGRLALRTARRRLVLRPSSAPLVLPARRSHATEALSDTWVVAETLPRSRLRG